jgi:hypothetical protein
MSQFTTYNVAFLIGQFGHIPCNRFLIGRMDTSTTVTAASKKIDAAAFLRQVARAEVAALIRYLHPSLDFSWVRFVFGSSHS